MKPDLILKQQFTDENDNVVFVIHELSHRATEEGGSETVMGEPIGVMFMPTESGAAEVVWRKG